MPATSTGSESREEPNILQLKDILRDELIAILDTIRGSKALVLDEDLSGALSFIVDFSVLKEHGVEKIFLLGPGPLDTGSIKGVLYFALPHVSKMKTIAEHIRMGSQDKKDTPREYSLQLVPRRTLLCERVLEEEGVLGDITIGEYRMDFIPLEDDLMSLELPATFKELYLDGDFSSIQYVARAIMRLQGLFGFFPRVVGKGDFAQILADNLTRMRLELTSSDPRGSLNSALAMSSAFDSVVIIDRGIDLVTPLLTQLTYEGLISEVFGISNGSVTLGGGSDAHGAGKKKRIALNSSDAIYGEIRNMNFAGVGSLLSKMSRQLQDTYESRHRAKTVQEIRSFVGRLSGLQQEHQSLKSHVTLAETILKRTQSDDFGAVLEIEQSLVGAGDVSREQLAHIDKLLALAEPHAPAPGVLRLMCLYALWRGPNFKQKTYDAWYEELTAAFGHHQAVTLDNLSKAGLLVPPSAAKSAAPSTTLNLIVSDVRENDPDDVSYVYSGYAPMSIRLLQCLSTGGVKSGWKGWDDVLAELPGETVDLMQSPSDRESDLIVADEVVRRLGEKAPATLVVFLGGCTFTEIAALRLLSQQHNHRYVAATTQIINGNTFLDPLIQKSP
ncbi:vacuolar protein sorting-like protein r-vps33a [Martensiomyces pterosporus]|nr:vacuolar protein sorting-like protein r-vps33a [Martensiomyces pterosporus]